MNLLEPAFDSLNNANGQKLTRRIVNIFGSVIHERPSSGTFLTLSRYAWTIWFKIRKNPGRSPYFSWIFKFCFTIDICIIGVGFGQFSTIQHWHYCPKPLLQKFWVLWPKSDKPKGSPMPIPKMVFRPWCLNCQCLSMEMMDQEFHAWSNTLFFHLIPLRGRVRCRHGQMRIKIQKSRVSRVSLVMGLKWMCYRPNNRRQWISYMIYLFWEFLPTSDRSW